jgi:hypothetical protein
MAQVHLHQPLRLVSHSLRVVMHVKNLKTGSLMCAIIQSACTGAQAKYEDGNAALVEDKQPGMQDLTASSSRRL